MKNRRSVLPIALGLLLFGYQSGRAGERPNNLKPILWTDPTDLETRDLINGIGGAEHAPVATPFTFVKEDLDGTSPKIVVVDANGVKWKVKVGPEARPETAVTRFVWAAGYITDEDYFLPSQKVEGMPGKLKRGGDSISPDGVVSNGRWERMNTKKTGHWKWADNPYSDTRELNGLRVLMAMLNNWDVKDVNNTIYETPSGEVMVVSDLGASLAGTSTRWPPPIQKGNLEQYRNTKFITHVSDKTVSFGSPSWPMMFGWMPAPPLPYRWLGAPLVLFGGTLPPDRIGERWIGRGIPKEDAKWIGGVMSRLSPAQLRDGFRSAAFTPEEVEGFAQVVEQRIAALNALP